MNLKYVEPTGHDYPTQLDESIASSKENGTSACCTFNRRGTLLAIGCREGHINVWDFETRSIATRLIGHTGIVTSVSWSRNGSKLLSSDWNGSLLLWDIATAAILIKIQFDHAIEHSWLHGRSTKLAMIHLHECQPLVLTFHQIKKEKRNKKTPASTKVISTDDKSIKLINYSSNDYHLGVKSIQLSEFTSIKQSFPKSSSKKKKSIKKPRITCAVFDKYHKHIYCGTSHGRLLIIEYKTWRIINDSDAQNKITNSQQQIKSIVFSRCGNYLVINCGDRIIRYIEVHDGGSSFKVEKQYQDAVERKNWNACCFSCNGEYICAASATQQCIIYIWQRCYERSLEKVLKGADSFVVDMVWHPIQPILISVTQCGEIQIWNQGWLETGENWSTFDANFNVVTQNVWDPQSKNDANNVQIDEEKWIQQQLNNMNQNKTEIEGENALIDIFKQDGNLEDFFSADEEEKDLLDVEKDGLNNELIHLPIQVQCKFDARQIAKYLADLKEETNIFTMVKEQEKGDKNSADIVIKEKEKEKEIIASSSMIKISNKNEKVLQNLTKHLSAASHHHHHHHAHHLNAKKRRKKKQKLRKGDNHKNNSNVMKQRQYAQNSNPFKSFGNNYNTLKMNASNVHKPSGAAAGHKRTLPQNNCAADEPHNKKHKTL